MSEDGIQFEQAEFGSEAQGAGACSSCAEPLVSEYWSIAGNATCARCHDGVAEMLGRGGGFGGFLRAGVLGSLGGVAGATIYYLVTKLTGYELSLIAILVGYLVGAAVRRGSGYRGGLRSPGLRRRPGSTAGPCDCGDSRDHGRESARIAAVRWTS